MLDFKMTNQQDALKSRNTHHPTTRTVQDEEQQHTNMNEMSNKSDSTLKTSEQEQQLLPALPKALSKPKVYENKLVPVDLRFGIVRAVSENPVNLYGAQEKVFRERSFAGRPKASICFVVRKPGCIICHEQGLVLSQLISEFAETKVAAWAVIKEINVDNEGLLRMYNEYFHFPFFMDAKMKLYKALGNRRMNLFKLLRLKDETKARIRSKNMTGTAFGPGEQFILGGILIFDAEGQIRYSFHEKSGGQEYPIEQIRAAIQMLVDDTDSSS